MGRGRSLFVEMAIAFIELLPCGVTEKVIEIMVK